jgi:putative transposase
MPRRNRCVEAGVAYHVTQRGVARQDVFFTHADRRVYEELAAEHIPEARVKVYAYCLMTNHVHWIVVPDEPDSLAVLFRRLHGRYAQYLNARRRRCGHLWQNRYSSCAIERGHLWNALRAGMVASPQEYAWSTAARHLEGPESRGPVDLDWGIWKEAGEAAGWRELIGAGDRLTDVLELRRCTYSGRPFGSDAFVERMEEKFGRHWRNPGRPRKPAKREMGTEPTVQVSAS